MPNVFKALSDPIFRQDVKRGVMDALNRGMVAGGLGAPVDLATMALRPFGYNVEKPVGGSEWIGDKMRQAGMVSDQRNALAEAAAGMLAPTGYADPIATGRAVAGLVGVAQTMGPAQKAATVYHGTPHKFDKFDSSKIGTGEGAQVYGHGLYFAESPDVARQYQEALSKQVSYGGRRVAETHPSDSPLEAGRHAVASRVANGEDAAAAIKAEANSWREQANFYRQYAKEVPEAAAEADSFEAVARGIESLSPAEFYKNSGSLYSVDLPDEAIARMLDWDKPLSQQSDIVKNAFLPLMRYGGVMTGGQAVQQLGGGAKVAEKLRSAGIPGIRYLDGGSRGVGKGTSNFVVFPGEENILKILTRNGQKVD